MVCSCPCIKDRADCSGVTRGDRMCAEPALPAGPLVGHAGRHRSYGLLHVKRCRKRKARAPRSSLWTCIQWPPKSAASERGFKGRVARAGAFEDLHRRAGRSDYRPSVALVLA